MSGDNSNIEQEIRGLFNITEDSNTEGTTTEDNTPENNTAANTETTETNADSASSTAQGEKDVDPTTNTDANQEPNTSTPPTETTEEEYNPEEHFTAKQNSAFAAMRVQTKGLENLVMRIVQATGRNPKNIAEAQEMLEGGLAIATAKSKQIPEEVQKEMENDKREIAELRQQQAKQNALAGFQKVKNTFKLSNADVNKYAEELVQKGINPFTQEVDLVSVYRDLHFEDIIKQAVERGVQEERARSTKAQQQSTTPSAQQGLPEGAGNSGNPIISVKDLDKLLDEQFKK